MYEGFDILKRAKETRFVSIIETLNYLYHQYNFIAQLRGDTRNSKLIKKYFLVITLITVNFRYFLQKKHVKMNYGLRKVVTELIHLLKYL
jgi:hypothetical protein